MEVNRERGQTKIKLGGTEYGLEVSFEKLVKIEEALGAGTLELFRKAATGGFNLTECVTIVSLAMMRDGDGLTDLEIGQAMVDDGLTNFIEPIGAFFTMAVNGGAKPRKKQAAKRS